MTTANLGVSFKKLTAGMKPIEVEKEGPDMFENTKVYEDCSICKTPNCLTWHQPTNSPVCTTCAANFTWVGIKR